MHMAKGTIVSLFTVFSAYISSVQCREATSGNRVEEAGVDLGGRRIIKNKTEHIAI